MGIKKKQNLSKWPAPNRLLASIPEPSTQESTSPTRLLPRRPPPPVASRSPTDSDQEPLLSVRSEDSRRAPSSSSENSPSRDSSVRSPLSTEASSASSPAPSSHSRRHLRPTWLDSSRTPTSAPSTPRELPSCQRTCSSPTESVESAPEEFDPLCLCLFAQIIRPVTQCSFLILSPIHLSIVISSRFPSCF